MKIRRKPRSQFLKTNCGKKKRIQRVNAALRKLTIKYYNINVRKVSSLLCPQNLITIKEVSVVKLSAIWKQHFAASCLEKSTSRLEIAL